jgi:hypothetical protein
VEVVHGGEPYGAQGVVAFAQKLLTLLDEGRFTATYKYAVLLALIDVCLEGTTASGAAPTTLTTRLLAEKVVEVYWPQSAVFAAESGAVVLRQNTGGQAEILTAIVQFRERYAPDPSAPLSQARLAAAQAYERLLRRVEWKLVEMPLPRLQLVGTTSDPFLFEIDWDDRIRRPEFTASRAITLVDRAGDYLVQLAGLLRPLIQRQWELMVARLNRQATEEALLHEFLFGVERIPLDPVRAPLRELQANRCFYCQRPIRGPAHVDHFIPWARHADNGIENLVVTDPSCNNSKREHLASAQHLKHWTTRFQEHSSEAAQLEEIATRARWEHHPDRTLSVARAIYLRLPRDARLWQRAREFVTPNPRTITQALSSRQGRHL